MFIKYTMWRKWIWLNKVNISALFVKLLSSCEPNNPALKVKCHLLSWRRWNRNNNQDSSLLGCHVMLLVKSYWQWWHNETSHVYYNKFSVKTEQIIAEKCKIHIKSVLWEESAGNFFHHLTGHCEVGSIINHYTAVMLSNLQCSVQQ
jgi:hypothetical protein